MWDCFVVDSLQNMYTAKWARGSARCIVIQSTHEHWFNVYTFFYKFFFWALYCIHRFRYTRDIKTSETMKRAETLLLQETLCQITERKREWMLNFFVPTWKGDSDYHKHPLVVMLDIYHSMKLLFHVAKRNSTFILRRSCFYTKNKSSWNLQPHHLLCKIFNELQNKFTTWKSYINHGKSIQAKWHFYLSKSSKKLLSFWIGSHFMYDTNV